MKEQFIEEFTYRASEHLRACFRPGMKVGQINRIIQTQVINASADTGYTVYRINILEPSLGEVTVMFNDGIEVRLPLEKRKEAAHV